ncbi:hypothetical protein BCR37DRAFT_376571 [Protomyces lactucae-debilis]|uniref:Uncharacterized protein n=1 Tax=Protomyces lactucae-debilis TaxID=2754530 RepID=A0A1Y2FT55_PROLT|nr:uncharacterized protein BCR37DRAFT_376571 [Protomyces lactucae-debilis]ORY87158.1 hypothetical protein BCR37DRAFT_376571 [Protomyces lactucae-debilis]
MAPQVLYAARGETSTQSSCLTRESKDTGNANLSMTGNGRSIFNERPSEPDQIPATRSHSTTAAELVCQSSSSAGIFDNPMDWQSSGAQKLGVKEFPFEQSSQRSSEGRLSRPSITRLASFSVQDDQPAALTAIMRPIETLQKAAPGLQRPSLYRSQTMPMVLSTSGSTSRPSLRSASSEFFGKDSLRIRRRPNAAPLAETMTRSCSSQGHSPYSASPIRRSFSSAKIMSSSASQFGHTMPPSPISPNTRHLTKSSTSTSSAPVLQAESGTSSVCWQMSPPRTPLSPLSFSRLNSLVPGKLSMAAADALFDHDDGLPPMEVQFMTAEDAYSV